MIRTIELMRKWLKYLVDIGKTIKRFGKNFKRMRKKKTLTNGGAAMWFLISNVLVLSFVWYRSVS